MKWCSNCILPNPDSAERCLFCGARDFLAEEPRRDDWEDPTAQRDGAESPVQEFSEAKEAAVAADSGSAEQFQSDTFDAEAESDGQHREGPPPSDFDPSTTMAAGGTSLSPSTSDGWPMLRRIYNAFWNQSGLFLAVELIAAILIGVMFINPVMNYMCRYWYGPPAISQIEMNRIKIRPGDNVRLTPITHVPCGGKATPLWKTTHGEISTDGPPFTLSTDGVREQVPFNIYVSLVIEDKCEGKSLEYRAPAPIEVSGPPRPKVTNVEPDKSQVWKGEPVELLAEADQPNVRYEWRIRDVTISGRDDLPRIKIDTSGTFIPMSFAQIHGTCTAISTDGERSDPKDFSFWVWKQFPAIRRSTRYRRNSGSRTKLIITPPGAPTPAGAGANQAPAPASQSNTSGATNTTPPSSSSPPPPAATPKP